MVKLVDLYSELDLNNGKLLPATNLPADLNQRIDWVEHGEWLAAAKRAGAEKVFFVENNPVAVFSECDSDLKDKVTAFNRTWCLARPRLLFLASPGEISVFDLAKKPVDINRPKEWTKLKALATLNDVGEVLETLQEFHRDNIESGRLFGDERFSDMKDRADKSLIRDLKTVRRELIHAGLSGDKVRFAHALIGRSIFIRYLEDRGVLTEEYFLNIAKENNKWMEVLDRPIKRVGLDSSNQQTFYTRILENKDLTYAVFRAMASDFNGDMFPGVDEEENVIQPTHLRLIQDLFYGDAGKQKKLFFYSYLFDIIPLELISSIYEEFYHSSTDDDEKRSKARQDGAYYSPPVLAEFILSRVLTESIIEKMPRVLDPACGSGIFLVEAFRRMVRYEWHKKGEPLTFDEIKGIVKNRIAGIEVNPEAARITAFSLYLSMLHYLEPRAIDQQIKLGNRLPNLIASDTISPNHYHCILVANAFDQDLIDSNPILRDRFGEESADIVVGNPPWGAPDRDADSETRQREQVMLEWCVKRKMPIGDKEPSQAFLWRSLSFLRDDKVGALLVSAGVLLKQNDTSFRFREEWLQNVNIQEVFNFSHVRSFFFNGSISPFVALIFVKQRTAYNKQVLYWSAKQTLVVRKNQYIVFSRNDMNIIRDEDLSDYRTWKIYDYGSYQDAQLIKRLDNDPRTKPLSDYTEFSRVGFKKANQKHDAGWLKEFRKVKNDFFSRYDPLDSWAFEDVPDKIEHHGVDRRSYEGKRILVKEGIQQSNNTHGRMIARYETEPYAFNHSIHVIKLIDDEDWMYKTVIGILWSSLARYYLFLTSGFWGTWLDKVLLRERLRLPVIINRNNSATNKIIKVVEDLQNCQPDKLYILNQLDEIETRRLQLENELDEAVYELYNLSEEQKDLMRDCCEVTLPYFYKPFSSIGATPAVTDNDSAGIEPYIKTFCRRWNNYLSDDEEMRAEIHIGAHENTVAVEFFPADKGDPWNITPKSDSWSYLIEKIGKTLPHVLGTSKVLLEGVVHVVSDDGIIIINQNERRYWTRSLARQDAESTLCRALLPLSGSEGGKA